MFGNIVLIIAIVTGEEVRIDYEFYDSKKSCEAISKEINEYPTNKTISPKVSSMCVELDMNLKPNKIEHKDI